MHDLSNIHRACLRKIAKAEYGAMPPCAETILADLLNWGLIRSEPKLSVPLEWHYTIYHITPRGRQCMTSG